MVCKSWRARSTATTPADLMLLLVWFWFGCFGGWLLVVGCWWLSTVAVFAATQESAAQSHKARKRGRAPEQPMPPRL
jgi:hypothetical protein